MDFYKRVSMVCNRIPYGRVATYGQIALLCGKPRNSRQVGYALNRRCGGEAPAYRVLGHNGRLTGAAAFLVPGLQRFLLEAEGVEVDASECVDLDKFGWHNTFEEAEELSALFERLGI